MSAKNQPAKLQPSLSKIPDSLAKNPVPILLIVLLIFSFLTRVADISHLPNGAYWDELDAGYQAYSLIQTGRDYHGNSLPVFLQSFADFRTPLAIYSIVPLVGLFTPDVSVVRINSILWSLPGIVAIYVLGSLVFKSRKAGFVSALFLSLSPWHFHYSRVGLEPISLVTMLTIATAFLALSIKNPNRLVWSYGFFGLSIYTYSTAKFFVPIFVLLISFWILRSQSVISRQILWLSIGVFALLLAPWGLDTFSGRNTTRFSHVSIFTDPTLKPEVNSLRLNSLISVYGTVPVGSSPRIIDILLNNAPLRLFEQFTKNYLSAYSTEFLFTTGDTQLRHSPGKLSIGQLLIPQAVALVLGIFSLGTSRISPQLRLLLVCWLLLGPLASAITRDGYGHASRLILLLPPLTLLSTLGFIKLSLHKPSMLAFITIFFSFSFWFFGYYFTHYRLESAKPFNWGFKQILTSAKTESANYTNIFIDARKENALMAFLYFNQIDPGRFQSLLPLKIQTFSDDISGVSFGNIIILPPGDRSWASLKLLGNNLVIADSNISSLPSSDKFLSTLFYPDQTPAYYSFKLP